MVVAASPVEAGALGAQASGVAPCGLTSRGSQALEHRLNSCSTGI